VSDRSSNDPIEHIELDRFFIVLLQYNGQLEMEAAICRAFIHNQQIISNPHANIVNPLLVLHVNRDSIVRDTINQVDKQR
jgi:hypothetical protein